MDEAATSRSRPRPPIRRVEFDPTAGVEDDRRLDALDRAVLCDTDPEPAFDRLTQLITELLDVPVALVSLVDDERQFFKSQQGLQEPWASQRQTPLSHSFCQYLVATDTPLVIADSRLDPMLATNGAVHDLGVISYAGFPIRGHDDLPIGSLCAIDGSPRQWSEADLDLLERLAEVVSDLVRVRTTAMVAEDRRVTISQLVDSQEAERSRVAAEIHDDTLQVLAALSIKLQLLARRADPDMGDEITSLVADLDDANRRVRRCVSDLRPDAFEHDTLANVLRTHLVNRAADQPDLHVDLDEDVRAEPDESSRITLFRIAQQAIANAIAHAAPSAISVTVRTAGDQTEVVVEDDGRGFDVAATAPRGHFGLRIMRERAEIVGGRTIVESVPGSGTRVTAAVPTVASPTLGPC